MRRRTAKIWLVALVCFLFGTWIVPRPGSAAGTVLPPLKIVQMGDSYSAGNGARDALDLSRKNYVGPKGCYRSPNNWGFQTANTPSLRQRFAVRYTNRACSGAVLADILNPRELETTFVVKGHKCPAAVGDEYWEQSKSDDVFDKCQHRVRPQIEAVDSSTDLVLMTVGGNDAKFANIVTKCFALFLRSPSGCKASVEYANAQLQVINENLTASLLEIHKRLGPKGRVVVVSYPYLVPDVQYRLWSLFGLNVYEAGNKIRELQLAGDAGQAAAIARANALAGQDFVTFLDGTKALFEGHVPNPDQNASRNPLRWVSEFEGFDPHEHYHLNPLGHEAMAKMVAEALGQMSLGQAFASGGSVLIDDVPRDENLAAALPDAWVGDAYVAAIDRPLVLDASGSYDPGGGALTGFEWDFNGDGSFDERTEGPIVTHTYAAAFEGLVTVRVTGPGGTAVASAPVLVNESGSAPQVDDVPCGTDVFGAPTLFDAQGRLKSCTVKTMPTQDSEGIAATSGGAPAPTTTTTSTTSPAAVTTLSPVTSAATTSTVPSTAPTTTSVITSSTTSSSNAPPTTDSTGRVPVVGSDPLPLAKGAVMLVVAGFGLITLARRRIRT